MTSYDDDDSTLSRANDYTYEKTESLESSLVKCSFKEQKHVLFYSSEYHMKATAAQSNIHLDDATIMMTSSTFLCFDGFREHKLLYRLKSSLDSSPITTLAFFKTQEGGCYPPQVGVIIAVCNTDAVL